MRSFFLPGAAIILCLATGMFVAMRFVFPISSFSPTAKQTVCSDHLKQIAVALLNYQDEHGRLPPAYVADDQGRPMHSWRILVLKYLDKELYDAYDFDEAWDGPNNCRLLAQIPHVYRCPNHRSAKAGGDTFTNYVALVGRNSVFERPRAKLLSDVFVGTVLLAEVGDSGIQWMEPRDLDVDEIDLSERSSDSLRQHLASSDPEGPAVVLGDLKIVRLR